MRQWRTSRDCVVPRYRQDYTLSSCPEVGDLGGGIPHLLDADMRPYGSSYMSRHHKRWSKHTIRTVSESLLDYLRWMECAAITLEKTKLRHDELYMNASVEANPNRPLNVSTVDGWAR